MRAWVLWTAIASPLFLIGGWTLAAFRQPAGYDSSVQTISSLAAIGVTDRWIMTTALAVQGLCYVGTAAGLPAAGLPGRVVLALGGLAAVAVAVFPLPRSGSSTAHTVSALIAFVAVAAWPLFALRRGAAPWPLTPTVSVVAAVVLLGLVAWFGLALATDARVGLAERVAAGAQSLWPLIVVLGVRSGG